MDIVYVVYKEQYFIYDDKFETTIVSAYFDEAKALRYVASVDVPGHTTKYYIEAVKVL